MNQKAKELEIQGCKTFVCPNLSLIDEKGKELNLREETIKRAKGLAIEYFRKTYHRPHYSSVRYVLPAFIYIATIFENDKRSQSDIASVFNTTCATITKWYRDVMDILDIKRPEKEKKIKMLYPEILDSEINNKFADEIYREGKILSLKDSTIKKAKDLATEYFEKANFNQRYSHIRQLSPAFIYMASVIENDKRNQYDIYKISGVTECVISKWYNDIIRTLGIKIISNNKRVIAVLERQENCI